MTSYVNQENTNTRDESYAKVIERIAKDGVCPFCRDHLTEYHPNPLSEKKYWWVTESAYPYKPTKHHRLIIHKEHISDVAELSEEAWKELFEIIKEEEKTNNIVGGTFMLRFGDTHFTGASVTHLHAHIIQSDPENAEYNKKTGILTRVG